MARVILAHAGDTPSRVDEIYQLLANDPVSIDENWQEMPDLWDKVVVLFVLSDAALADTSLYTFAKAVTANDIPLIPVVDDLTTFRFDQLPSQWHMLRERNARSMTGQAHENLRPSVLNYLGLPTFLQGREVFISYRRSDGSALAHAIYDQLWNQKIAAFLDEFAIHGGEVVQEKIYHAIDRKDMILLVDSPDAANSEWVAQELLTAQERRIPVCAVSTAEGVIHPQVRDVPRLVWDDAKQEQLLERIGLLVSRCIASHDSLDLRVDRTLKSYGRINDLNIKSIGTRLYHVSSKTWQLVIEFEDAPVSVERLYRLHRTLTAEMLGNRGLFVCGDYLISNATQQAVDWVCRDEPLSAAPLSMLQSQLNLMKV